MKTGDSSLSQSRLDEAAGGTSFRSHTSLASAKPPRPSGTSGADAADIAGDASIAFSDTNSERLSKPRSQAPSQRAPSQAGSARGSRPPSETNFTFGNTAGQPQASVDDDAASLAPSERSSRPRTSALQPASPAMSQRTPSVTSNKGGAGGGAGSRLASEPNFAFGVGEDDDGASSASMSERPSKPRSAHSGQEARAPSVAGGGGSGLGASQSSLGGDVDFGGDDNDDSVSIARSSKARSSGAASQRAPSISGEVGGGGSGASRKGSESGSRKASESGLGFSGFSTQGGKEPEDGAGEDDAGSQKKGRSGSGSISGSVAPTGSQRGGQSSRKTSEVNPSGGGGGGTSGGISGLGESALGGDASIAFSDAASDVGGKAPSASAGRGGSGSRSSRPSGGVSGAISYSKDGDDADGGASAAPPSRRRSFASSLRQSVASHKTASAAGSDGSDDGGGADGDGDGGDAASTRSGISATSGKSRASSAALSKSTSAVSARSGQSSAPAPPSSSSRRTTERSATSKSTKSSEPNEYGDEDFEEDVAEDDGEDEEEAAADEEDGEVGGSGSGGDEAARSESVASGSKRSSAAGSRPVSGSSRVSTARTGSGRYSNEFDAASASGRQSGGAAGSGGAADEEAAAVAASGSIFRGGSAGAPQPLSVSGSILQAPGDNATPGSRKSGGSVFRRLPADAPDDGGSTAGDARQPLQRSGSSFRSDSQADAAAAGAGEWNEGAVRVAAPGAPRPFTARHEGGGVYSRPRPMSAAPRDRQGAVLDALIRKHPSTWDATDVATWVEFLGLGQYRRRFLHHCIDGRLLLRVTDAQLKSELGIGPMGHRCAILDSVATLVKDFKEAQRERMAALGSDGGADSDSPAGSGYGRSSTAPRARPRPASAMPGALTTAPPPPPTHHPRRPASASRSVLPPDPFLGPAMGKVTVYEQRAKLLFELDRAQARAEQHRVLAEQLQYTATLSTEEVNHIRGLLTEIERKNRQAFELSGGVDSAARIPWRHVGKGTKHNNWNPERFARPGDPETVDLTFQPRCTNPESRKLLGLGGGDYGEHPSAVNSFLDRLNNDLRKREQSRKELERRYYSDGSTNPMAQADADFNFVAEALQQRCHITMEREAAEYEAQIDEALDKLANGESWREAGLRDGPIRAAKGTAKLAAFASAIRSLSFMERYRSDLRSKGSRTKALEKKWINQTLGAQYLPGGKDKDDLDEAAKFFALLGWRDGNGNAAEDAVDPELLDRLLTRAIEYRKKYDGWWERVRDKPEERAAGFKCDINWMGHPWDSDGLGALMDAEMQRMGEASGGPSDFVEFTVKLLGKCREDDLHRLVSLGPRPKRLGVYRAIRTQKFIEFTQKDLEERDRKLREVYDALAPPRRKLPPTRIEGFFDRLVDDAAKRRAKAEKMAHDKVLKEQEILASSVMYGRPRRR